MSEPEDLNTEDKTDVEVAEQASTWAVSVCFWTTLMVAATCYGAVALAPKFSMWSEARDEYRRNGLQLAELEKKVDYLERVKVTLETDSEFVTRLSRSSGAHREGEERDQSDLIPVSGNLLFGGTNEDVETISAPETPTRKPGLVFHLASAKRLRNSLLIFSACLTVFAFTFLNDAGASLVSLTGRLVKATVMFPVARYVSHTEDDEEQFDDES